MSLDVRVKEEPLWEKDSTCGVSEAAAGAGLYVNHKVKDEVVLGPEVLQLPHVDVYIKKEEDDSNKVECIKQEKSPKKEPECENDTSLHNYSNAEALAGNSTVTDELGPKLESFDRTAPLQISNKASGSKSPPAMTTHEESTEIPRKRQDTKKHYCEICKIEFTKWSSLNRHKRKHNNTFHVCNLCKKEFTRLDHLQNHMRTHTGLKPYSCHSCEKKFTQLSNLKRHERLHKGVKPFFCEVCKKEFTLLSHLNDHKLLHSGVKNHVCEVCEKRFTLLSDLKRHKKLHLLRKAT